MERTLAIIKPDVVSAGYIGEIINRIENEGIKIVAMKMEHLDNRKAEGFYYIHKQKPFFQDLLKYITSGPIVVMVLQGDNMVERWRKLMGTTNPDEADRGTIRGDMGTDIERNVVHGSDSKDNAVYEINYFFKGTDVI
ncbi:nucleoside-diphosphate kinase [Calditrichota bacterium]